MKTRYFLQAVVILFVSILLFSCRSSRETSHTHRYPKHRSSLPPGHAKKVYGHRSARVFAPGQQKKRDVHYRHHHDDHDKRKKDRKKGRH